MEVTASDSSQPIKVFGSYDLSANEKIEGKISGNVATIQSVEKYDGFYETEFSNVGRSVHTLAVKATNKFEETRDIVKSYVNAKHREEIIFTKGATEAINLVANTYGEKFIKEGDEIIVTELEHHSNYVPWHFLRKSKNIKINFAEINEEGEITLEEIEKKNNSKNKINFYYSSVECNRCNFAP